MRRPEREDGGVLHTANRECAMDVDNTYVAKGGIQKKEDRPVAKNERHIRKNDSSVIPLQVPLRAYRVLLSSGVVQF